MPFSEGWRDQYERTLRSHKRLIEAARSSTLGSNEARDRLYHFFQDAYHLKDWVKNDDSDPTVLTATIRSTVESIFDKISGIPVLQLAADLCNGVKHLRLTHSTKTGDKSTGFTSQSAVLTPGVFETVAEFGSPIPASPPAVATAEHRWTVTSNNQTYDAASLADEVVGEWKSWLTTKGLLQRD